MRRRTCSRGFTLVEVLVALAITVFVAAASYTGISAVISGAEQLGKSNQRVREINAALATLDRDLRQFIDRPVRDEFGVDQPSLAGGPLAFFPLMLTRGGWHNTVDLPRSELQRVVYYLDEGALWRAYFPVLDRAIDTQMLRLRLVEGVESIEFRFLRDATTLQVARDLTVDTRDWERNWIAEPGGQNLLPPPAALEVRLELDDLGELRRFYALGP